MTKLEWCRQHAPEVLCELSDEDLLSMLSTSYERFVTDGKCVVELDAGWNNTIYGVTRYKCEDIYCNGLRLEQMVGDKLLLVFSKRRLSHVKDLYDLYVISEECNLNLALVHGCMLQRYGVNTFWDTWPFDEEAIIKYKQAYDKLQITCIDGRNVEKINFETAFKRLSYLVPNVKDSNPRCIYIWNAERKMVSIDAM